MIHKVKDFKTYQAVRINQKMISSYFRDDKHSVSALENDAFFSPELSCIIMKSKKTEEERFIPLTNVQDFSLVDSVLKPKIELAVNLTEETTEDGAEQEATDPAPVKPVKTPKPKKTKE